ncbi:hypothetical protein BJX70DRAFT_84963 [Aspergillus crustosus]
MPEARYANINNLDIHTSLKSNMDLGQFVSGALDFAGKSISQASQVSGQVIKDVGCGTATLIHGIAEMSEAAITAGTTASRDLTNTVADCARDAGGAIGIAPVTDTAMDLVKGCSEITAGAVNLGVGLPIGAAKGTAEVISFAAKTSGEAVMAAGEGVSAGLSIAARPGEGIIHMADGVWPWLKNSAYALVTEEIKQVSLPDPVLLGVVMVILLLVTICFIVMVLTFISLAEGRRP